MLSQHAVVPAPANTFRASLDAADECADRALWICWNFLPVSYVTGGPGAYGGYVIELAKAAGELLLLMQRKPIERFWKRWA